MEKVMINLLQNKQYMISQTKEYHSLTHTSIF